MNNHRSHTTAAEPPPAEPRQPVDDEPPVHLRGSSRHDAVGHASHHRAAGPPVPADTVGGHVPMDTGASPMRAMTSRQGTIPRPFVAASGGA